MKQVTVMVQIAITMEVPVDMDLDEVKTGLHRSPGGGREGILHPLDTGEVERIRTELNELLTIISDKDADAMKRYLTRIREHIK